MAFVILYIPCSNIVFYALKDPRKAYEAIDALIMAWDIYALSNDIDNCYERKAVESMVAVLKEQKNG